MNPRPPATQAGPAVLLALLLLLLPACGRSPGPAAGVADATGARVDVPAAPRRIVSLAPSVTEALFRLGAGDRTVGVTEYCTRPGEAASLPKVGSYIRPELEKIVSLRPDLVLAVKDRMWNPGPLERLRGMGVTVFVLGQQNDFESSAAVYLEIGSLVGAEARARETIEGARARLETVRRRLAGRPPVSVFVQLGARPLVTAGRDTFVHDALVRAGAENLAATLGSGYPVVDRETAVGLDPEAVFITTMAGFPESERDRWLSFGNLKAVRAGRVFLVDGDDFCRPDPFALVATVETVARKLHPDAFGAETVEDDDR